MPLVLADRVYETSVTTGTGALTLDGAVSGYRTFSTLIGNGNTTYYTIWNKGALAEYETGIGTVSAGVLTRTTVLQSSNANAAVNLSAGTKDVFCTLVAQRMPYVDGTELVLPNSAKVPFSLLTSDIFAFAAAQG